MRLGAATTPLIRQASVMIGAHPYTIGAGASQRADRSVTVRGGLDIPVTAGTPVYYGGPAADVSVEYLDITHDLHNTTGTIATGTGWTITHNNIHDGYSTPGNGVAIYGGDQGIIEYNCLSRMGDYGVNIFGSGSKFDYNEVYQSNYRPDPGCGCSGGGKWWATLNADIVGNAFVDDSPGGGNPVWLDNGNSGTLISGNYFYRSYGSAVVSETGFNLKVTGNLFMDGGWGKGSGGCGNNCDGAVNLNSSGGFNVPGSRYENQVLITGNQFVDNWQGIAIWQAGARSCENSGESWPDDAAYCSGGFPNSASVASGGRYYFSHEGDGAHGGSTSLAEPAAAGSSTVLVAGAAAIDDQIGFGDPVSTRTTDRTDVATLTGSATINAKTTGFPASGELRVGTSAAWADGGGSYTGAVLSYRGITPAGFTGVSLVRGSGTLACPDPGGPALQGHRRNVLRQRLRAAGLSAASHAGGGRRRGQQRRHVPALRHEFGASLRSAGARWHFLLGRLPVGGQGHLRDWQCLPVQPVGHRIERSPGRRPENDHVRGGTRQLMRNQLHGLSSKRGGSVRYPAGRQRDDEQPFPYRMPVMGYRLYYRPAVQSECRGQPARSAARPSHSAR